MTDNFFLTRIDNILLNAKSYLFKTPLNYITTVSRIILGKTHISVIHRRHRVDLLVDCQRPSVAVQQDSIMANLVNFQYYGWESSARCARWEADFLVYFLDHSPISSLLFVSRHRWKNVTSFLCHSLLIPLIFIKAPSGHRNKRKNAGQGLR